MTNKKKLTFLSPVTLWQWTATKLCMQIQHARLIFADPTSSFGAEGYENLGKILPITFFAHKSRINEELDRYCEI